jgi:ribosomal protein L37AE/L43A
MSEADLNQAIARPTRCPFCQGTVIDTLAKVITASSLWRCRGCEETWTLASRPGSSAGSPWMSR